MSSDYESRRLSSERDRNQFLIKMPLNEGVVKREWVLLAGFPRNYNASQRIKYLLEQELITSKETGKKYGRVPELAYYITDKGSSYRDLLIAQEEAGIVQEQKDKAPNFDLFNENKESPIAMLMAEIKEMESDLRFIKEIAGKYMDVE